MWLLFLVIFSVKQAHLRPGAFQLIQHIDEFSLLVWLACQLVPACVGDCGRKKFPQKRFLISLIIRTNNWQCWAVVSKARIGPMPHVPRWSYFGFRFLAIHVYEYAILRQPDLWSCSHSSHITSVCYNLKFVSVRYWGSCWIYYFTGSHSLAAAKT